MDPRQLLRHAQRLQALAQAGLTFTQSPYDIERYQEIRQISAELLGAVTDEPMEKIVRVFASDEGYQTPKLDIRVVVFGEGREILLVREKHDHGRWTLPGGWADVGYSPFEVAAKEAREETGLEVEPVRLLAVFDKSKHAHPAAPHYAYKLFIECRAKGGTLLGETTETFGARWFAEAEVDGLELSTDRVTASQIHTMFRFADEPGLAALCD